MQIRTFIVLGTLILGGTAAWWVIQDPGTGEVLDELPTDAEGMPLDERTVRGRHDAELRAQARNTNLAARDAAPQPVVDPFGDGRIDRSSAESGFDFKMTELETLARERTRIDRPTWDEHYRQANDAFAALSSTLDANEPGDREALEQAHQRLQEALRRVRVRGRKFSDI